MDETSTPNILDNLIDKAKGPKDETGKNKEEHLEDFMKSFAAIEYEIEPYRDQLKDLKKNYVDNCWLEKDDIKLAIKAYRFLKKDGSDLDKFNEIFEQIKRQFGSDL